MSAKGIVLRGEDHTVEVRAKAAGLEVVAADGYELPFAKTLFVEAGTRVPWDLLPAAWHFLERWDVAVPLWKYGTLAGDVGTPAEREATKAITRDLRLLLHSVELLFVRDNEAGRALVGALAEEEGNRRLAFLRAMYRVKPRVCVLPVTWLAEVRQQSKQVLHARPRSPNAGKPLVRVEIEPGRFVKCHEGDEEKVLAHFEQIRGRGG